MNLIDIIIVVVAVVGFILGFKDGLVRKLIGLVGFCIAVYASIRFAFSFGEIIVKITGIEIYLSEIIGGIIIFFGIIFIFSVIKRLVHPFDKVNNLVNRILGGVVGAIQILFFLSAVFFLMNIFNAPSKQATKDSFFYKSVYNILPFTIDTINSLTPKTKQLIKSYINEKDTI